MSLLGFILRNALRSMRRFVMIICNTCAEVAFEFRITSTLLVAGSAFAIMMGVVGGLLPAPYAALKLVQVALRSM